MDKVEITLDVLGRITGKSEQEVVSLLKNDESESGYKSGEDLTKTIEGLIGEKFKSISEQQRGRAKREVMSSFEKEIRSNFGVDNADLRGLDLVNHLVQSAKTTTNELTPDTIKSHPFFREAIQSKNEELKSVQSEFASYKQEQSQRQIRSQVEQKAKSLLLSLNPVLPKNESVRQNQVKMFLSSMGGNFKVTENGINVLDNDGQELLDGSYNPVGFDQFVRQKAQSFFDFHEVDQSKRSPQDKTQHRTTSGNNFPTFTNMNEAMQYLNTLKKEDTKKAMEFAQNINQFVKQ